MKSTKSGTSNPTRSKSHLFVEEDQLCEKILDIHQAIRCAGIYNENRIKLAGGMRNGTMSFLTQDQTEESIYKN